MLKVSSLPAQPAGIALPELKIKPAGYAGKLLAVQVAVTQWNGRVVGAAVLSHKGKDALRLEVTRLIEVDREVGLDEAAYKMLQRKLGHKSEDRLCRPDGRHSLVISQEGPRGLSNLKPWFAAFAQLKTGAAAARAAAELGGQYGIIAVLELSPWALRTPVGHPAFNEATVVGISDAEVIELQ